MSKFMSAYRAAIFLFAAMMLTGANLPLGKYLATQLPIYLLLFSRFAVFALVLAVIVRHEPGPHLHQMSRAQIRDVMLMAAFGMIGFMALMLEGLKRTSAIDAGVITATIPAIVVLLGVIFLRERPTLRQLAAVAFAVAGIAIIQLATISGASSTGSLPGNFLIAGAVVGEASFVIFSKRLVPPYRPIRLALAANLAGLILSAPLATGDLSNLDTATLTPLIWLLATWYVLTAGVFVLLLWYRGLPFVDTWLAGVAMSAIPVTAFVTSTLFLDESFGFGQIAGAIVVIVAIIVAAGANRPASPG